MNKRILLGFLRIIIGLTVLVAVAVQLFHGLDTNPTFNVSNFFSFFTIESNIFGAIVMLVSAFFLLSNRWSTHLDTFRGAATLYMTITGITYFILLRGIEDQLQTPIPWVNFVLHYAFPIAILLDWLVTPLKKKISFNQALSWLFFPIAYLLYSMIRGYFTFWYPYPFLNPILTEPYKIVITMFGIAIVALAGALILARNKNLIERKLA